MLSEGTRLTIWIIIILLDVWILVDTAYNNN